MRAGLTRLASTNQGGPVAKGSGNEPLAWIFHSSKPFTRSALRIHPLSCIHAGERPVELDAITVHVMLTGQCEPI
jgi:hypothetical protein